MTPTAQSADSKSLSTVVALVGFMGCGKTTTGGVLATLLGWKFVDLDEVIERQEGVSIRELFRERGEMGFRAIESEVLQRCLADCPSAAIFALGGGAYVQPKNVELLRNFQVRAVFLKAPVEELLRRCGVEDSDEAEGVRPLAADATSFRKLYEERLPAYRSAEVTILTLGKSVTEIAKEIAQRLQLVTVREE